MFQTCHSYDLFRFSVTKIKASLTSKKEKDLFYTAFLYSEVKPNSHFLYTVQFSIIDQCSLEAVLVVNKAPH